MSMSNGLSIPSLGTSSTVTLGIMATIVAIVASGFYTYGKLANQTDINTAEIQRHSSQMQEFPSRQEIAQQIQPLQADVKDIKADVKALLSNKIR